MSNEVVPIVLQKTGLHRMKRKTKWRTTLLIILFVPSVWTSFADAPWYITPIQVKTHTEVLQVYGMFYQDVVSGKDESGQPIKVRFGLHFLRDTLESIRVINQNDVIITNRDGNATRIFDVDHFLTPRGLLQYFRNYRMDKDSSALWVEENDYGSATLGEIEEVRINGPTEGHPVVTGKPEDLMIGKGLYRIKFRTEVECPAEFQSDSEKITEKELIQIFPLLIGVSGGLLHSRYPIKGIYDFSDSISDREEYCDFAASRVSEFEETILRLKSHDIIPEFEEQRNSIVKNYEERLRYLKIMFKWLENDDFDKFSSDVIEFYSDTTVLSILESIRTSDDWLKRFKMMNFQLHNYLNRVKYPFGELNSKQDVLLEKNHLRIVYDPRCQD